eukprot:GHRR01004281.1.p1 GENE.GHRR01004281.1~~GHRR01004281.1.p1  ORF type:complete len:223 (+),score=63.63 GHRR01004281.1:164-832(+)
MKVKSMLGSKCRAKALGQSYPTVLRPCRLAVRAVNVAEPSNGREQTSFVSRVQESFTSVLQAASVLACTASLVLTPAAVADEGGIILRLPAAEDPEVFQAQQTLFEAWNIVGDSYVDEQFNGHWWPEALKNHMMAVYNSKNGRAAYKEIGAMLAELGDPYTRIIPPNEYADFRVSSDGELQGVGLLIANEPYNNHLLVLSTIKGGPADRAGITSGVLPQNLP